MAFAIAEFASVRQERQLPYGPLGHLRPLDGLRGIAVMAVFLVHLYSPVFGGGGWGVDLFFVISGFLITKLLYEEYDRSQRVDLRGFYLRRLFRLQPAMLVLLAVVVIASFGAFSAVGGVVRRQALYTVLLSGNLFAIGEGSVARPVLGHTWSLGLEEQFYLVWPFLLVAIPAVAYGRPAQFLRGLAFVTIGMILFARVVVIGILDYPHWQSIPFFNMEGLLFGCMLAVYLHTSNGLAPRVRTWVVALCVAVVVFDLFVGGRYIPLDDYGIRPVVLRLIFTYIVFVAATARDWQPVRLLDNGILRWLGAISYSLYLWHIPVFEYFDDKRFPDVNNVLLLGTKVVMAFVAACASFYLIEKPAIRLYRRRSADQRTRQTVPA